MRMKITMLVPNGYIASKQLFKINVVNVGRRTMRTRRSLRRLSMDQKLAENEPQPSSSKDLPLDDPIQVRNRCGSEAGVDITPQTDNILSRRTKSPSIDVDLKETTKARRQKAAAKWSVVKKSGTETSAVS